MCLVEEIDGAEKEMGLVVMHSSLGQVGSRGYEGESPSQ